MNKRLLLAVFSLFLIGAINAQDVTIIDYETSSTNATFQYFGSALEPGMNQIIANPDASGINMSDSVGQFQKPASGDVITQTWAGGFALLEDSIDLTTNSMICMKVWFSHPGNVLFKLEEGTQGIWEQQQSVTDTMQWVEICFNTQIANPAVAAGGKYKKPVLFFDFGTVPTEDQTYYFDDIVTKAGSADPVDVTFKVNMNDYIDAGGAINTGMFIGATFNDWSDSATPMTDADSDGIWEATVSLQPGPIEFKYIVDNWNTSENLAPYLSCTQEFDGGFVNRVYTVGEAVVMDPVCYESCYNCGDAVNITVNIGAGDAQVSEDGFFMAGGGNFGNPGDNQFTDNGDGTYTIMFEKPMGFTSYYTFTNGNCPDWSCKENIEGQSCANPDNFNDRKMENVMSDTIINTCFAQCVDTVCAGTPPATYMVEFSVDMSGYTEAFTQVYVSGTINNWSGDANALTDMGDGIWTGTVEVVEGMQEYKFTLDNWTVQEQFEEGAECTVTNGGFTNRSIDVTEDMAVCFLWDSCEACAVGIEAIETADIFTIAPTLVTDATVIKFVDGFTKEKNLVVYDAVGQRVFNTTIAQGMTQYVLDMNQLNNGVYLINIQTEQFQQTQKVIVKR